MNRKIIMVSLLSLCFSYNAFGANAACVVDKDVDVRPFWGEEDKDNSIKREVLVSILIILKGIECEAKKGRRHFDVKYLTFGGGIKPPLFTGEVEGTSSEGVKGICLMDFNDKNQWERIRCSYIYVLNDERAKSLADIIKNRMKCNDDKKLKQLIGMDSKTTLTQESLLQLSGGLKIIFR